MSDSFKEALVRADLDLLRRVPKSDLHNHAFLGGNADFVERYYGKKIPKLSRPLHSMDEMHKWVGEALGDVFDGPDGRLKAIAAAFEQAKLDGVTLLEIGDDIWAKCLYGDSAAEHTRRMIELHKAIEPNIRWIPQLGISRHCPVDQLTDWIEPYLSLDIYKSLDLYGDEFSQPIKNFKPLYRRAKQEGLRLKAHVGEWGTAESVQEAVEELELHEVQHGIAAATSKPVMRFLVDNKIKLHICPTSNVMLGRASSLKTHPVRILFDEGVLVTINTDDALIFQQGVSEEFLNLYQAGLFSADELDVMRCTGLSSWNQPL